MSVDEKTVRRIARLSRIAVTDDEIPQLQDKLNAILDFVAQLDQVDVRDVEPMTSVMPMRMKMRADRVTEGEMADRILANSPASQDGYFMVPKVIE